MGYDRGGGASERRRGIVAALGVTGVAVALVALVALGAGTAAADASVDACTTIDSPGAYELGGDVGPTAGTCIRINASDVVLDGNGHTVDGGGSGTGVYVRNGSGTLRNVTVRDLTVDSWSTGVEFYRVEDARIEGVTAESSAGEGVRTFQGSVVLRDVTALRNGAGVSVGTQRATVRGVVATDNTDGVALTGADNATVTDARVTDNAERGVLVSGASDVLLRNVTARNNRDGVLAEPSSSGFFVFPAENVSVVESTFVGNSRNGIHVRGAADGTVRTTTVSGGRWGINASAGSKRTTIADVSVELTTRTSVQLRNASASDLRNVSVTTDGGEGIELIDSSTLDVVDVDVAAKYTGLLIDARSGPLSNVDVEDVTVTKASNGIRVVGRDRTSGLSFDDVAVTDTSGDGVEIGDASDVAVTNLTVTDTDLDGLVLSDAERAVVRGLTLRDNEDSPIVVRWGSTESRLRDVDLEWGTYDVDARNATIADTVDPYWRYDLPNSPTGKAGIGAYVRYSLRSNTVGYLDLTARYDAADVPGYADASTLAYRVYDESAERWEYRPSSHDAGADTVSTNVTYLHPNTRGVLAPLADARYTQLHQCTGIDAAGRYALGSTVETFPDDDVCFQVNVSDVVLDGYGHAIEHDADPGNVVDVEGNNVSAAVAAQFLDNVTVRNASVRGVSGERITHAVFANGSRLSVRNVSFANFTRAISVRSARYEDGNLVAEFVSGRNGHTLIETSNLTATGLFEVAARNLTGAGVEVVDGVKFVDVYHATFENVSAGVAVGPYGSTAYNQTILSDVDVRDARTGVRASGHGLFSLDGISTSAVFDAVEVHDSPNVLVADANLTQAETGVNLSHVRNARVRDVAFATGGHGLAVDASAFVDVESLTVGGRWNDGVLIEDSRRINLTDAAIRNSTYWNVELDGTSETRLTNVTLAGAGTGLLRDFDTGGPTAGRNVSAGAGVVSFNTRNLSVTAIPSVPATPPGKARAGSAINVTALHGDATIGLTLPYDGDDLGQVEESSVSTYGYGPTFSGRAWGDLGGFLDTDDDEVRASFGVGSGIPADDWVVLAALGNVSQTPSFAVSNLSVPANVTRGQTLDVTGNVSNVGAGGGTLNATAWLDADADGTLDAGDASARTELALGSGDSRRITLSVPIPDGQAAGEYDVSLSTPNDTATGRVRVEAPATANFSVSNLSAPPNVTRGDSYAVAADVTNVGGREDTQVVAYRVDGSVVASAPLPIGPGGGGRLTFTIDAVDTAGFPTGTVTQGFHTENDSLTARLNVSAAAAAEFAVSNLSVPANVTRGDSYAVAADVTNVGGEQGRATVEYRVAGNVTASRSVRLLAGERRRVSVTVTGSDTAGFPAGTVTQGFYTANDSATAPLDVEREDARIVFPGQSAPATDVDGDGRYEDVTGDGSFDVLDVAELLAVFDDVPESDAALVAAADFSGDGSINILDVAALLEET